MSSKQLLVLLLIGIIALLSSTSSLATGHRKPKQPPSVSDHLKPPRVLSENVEAFYGEDSYKKGYKPPPKKKPPHHGHL
ncbi:hypothetical protein M5689_006017 [Euphorbia peplus]|nr:hypothetical protein M5689_006017 [Euphorbia peplus]